MKPSAQALFITLAMLLTLTACGEPIETPAAKGTAVQSLHAAAAVDATHPLEPSAAPTRTSEPTATLPPNPTPTARATNTPRPTATIPPAVIATPVPFVAPASQNCDPSYPDVCIPRYPPDLNCGDIPHRRFRVLQPDPHNFDRDRDGIGCESG